jgi:hypothetical protein
MENDNLIPVVTRTQVYLTDPEFFCNKSWTLSFNFNTKSWISFHSYIPNFYIGENNFFYSGINGCCSDLEGQFTALVGNPDKPITTTTTTTGPIPPTTTTTTAIPIDCTIEGVIVLTYCELEGDAIITVPPTTTTTICQRPFGLNVYQLVEGYQIGTDPAVVSSGSLIDACSAISTISSLDPLISVNWFAGVANSLDVLEIVYYGPGTNCIFAPDGWYFTQEGLVKGFVYQIFNGFVSSIGYCDCGNTDKIIAPPPNIDECCGIFASSGDEITYYNNSAVNTLIVPGYTTALGTAMTSTKFWSIDTDIKEWDITTTPFSAVYNRAITFPGGFTTSSGIVAINNTTLVTIDDSTSPQDVVEMDITTTTGVPTVMFSLQADRVAIGNMLYTTGDKLLVINQDSITSDYYITQYEYSTGTLEVDVNIGTVSAVGLFECDCIIYVIDQFQNTYVIGKTAPYELFGHASLGIVGTLFTQIGTCVPTSITENANLTTTTTTTFVPNTYCHTVRVNGSCSLSWIDYSGTIQFQTVTNDAIYICAQLYSITQSCTSGSSISISGGVDSCTDDLQCTTTTTTTIP